MVLHPCKLQNRKLQDFLHRLRVKVVHCDIPFNSNINVSSPPQVGPKQLCALAHLECKYSKTSWDTVKCPGNKQCISKQCILRYVFIQHCDKMLQYQCLVRLILFSKYTVYLKYQGVQWDLDFSFRVSFCNFFENNLKHIQQNWLFCFNMCTL